MSTRHSLPAASDSADSADKAPRSARTLAALAIVIGFGLCLLVAFTPDAAAPTSAVPEVEAAPEQHMPLGA